MASAAIKHNFLNSTDWGGIKNFGWEEQPGVTTTWAAEAGVTTTWNAACLPSLPKDIDIPPKLILDPPKNFTSTVWAQATPIPDC